MTLFKDIIPYRSNPLATKSGEKDERFLVPVYDLKEASDAYGLEVIVPGVAKDAVTMEVDQGQLVITARHGWKAPKGWTEIFRETPEEDYQFRLDLNDSVDVEGINASLEQGVLRVTLPKAEAIKPRKIAVE
jgi:HSP20 family molecular chaperone IbpA